MPRPIPMGDPTPRLARVRTPSGRTLPAPSATSDRTPSAHTRGHHGLDDADPQFLAIRRRDFIEPDDDSTATPLT